MAFGCFCNFSPIFFLNGGEDVRMLLVSLSSSRYSMLNAKWVSMPVLSDDRAVQLYLTKRLGEVVAAEALPELMRARNLPS